MIVCFECSQEAKRLLDSLLEEYSYDDYSQAIESALQTLNLLKREMGGQKSIVIGKSTKATQSVMDKILEEASGPTRFKSEVSQGTRRSPVNSIPRLFRQEGLTEPSDIAAMTEDSRPSQNEVPLDQWLFAMYNKLLPAKVNCRALAHLQAELGGGVPLSVAHDRVGEQVPGLGDYLKRLDSKHKLTRDEAVSVAFPLSRDKGDKSVKRYVYQFVGNVNKSRQVSGMLWSLKLIGSDGGKDPQIMLTNAGWEFACLENPLLDQQRMDSSDKFSSEEAAFLLSHIRSHVPVEAYAYRTILSKVSRGNDSPDELDAALRALMIDGESDRYTDSFLSSQRSGAISRMADLGLIARIRQGVRVKYRATEVGLRFLNDGRENSNESQGDAQ